MGVLCLMMAFGVDPAEHMAAPAGGAQAAPCVYLSPCLSLSLSLYVYIYIYT